MSKLSIATVAIVLAVLGGLAFMFWPTPRPLVVATETAAPAPLPASAPAPPAILHPIELAASAPEPAASAPPPLPALADANATVKGLLIDLLGRKAVLSLLQPEDFVRHVAATVDSLPRNHVAPAVWPVVPTSGRFTVLSKDGVDVINPDNSQRYVPLVLLAESVDVATVAAAYRRLYPLFQQAYEELGYPGRYFNDRLVEVIDHLLATPQAPRVVAVKLTEVKGPIPSNRPWVRYEFADPQLQSLSAGQRILLRSGDVNQRRLMARLRDLRRQIAR